MSTTLTSMSITSSVDYPITALTTIFTPPSYCSTLLYYLGQEFDRDVICDFDNYATYYPACFPGSPDLDRLLLYSPAIGCPADYETAATSLQDDGNTRVHCCPSGYRTTGTRYCIRPGTGMITGFSCTDSGVNTVPFSTAGSVWGKQVQLVIVNTEATSTSEPTFIVAGTSTRNPSFLTATSTADPSHPGETTGPTKKMGISGGAIAGIVVGVLAVAILVAAALFLVRRRKQRQHAAAANPDALPEYVGGNGVTKGPTQMTTQSSTGLFQPQPELRGPLR